MVVIFCYFQKENYKVLKFYVNNFPFFEMSTSICSAYDRSGHNVTATNLKCL